MGENARINCSSQQLWEDYLFLTRELDKFAGNGDIDMVNTMIEQREQLQKKIETTPDEGFRVSSQGKAVLAEVDRMNHIITQKLQTDINTGKKQQRIASAYEGGAATEIIGSRDWSR